MKLFTLSFCVLSIGFGCITPAPAPNSPKANRVASTPGPPSSQEQKALPLSKSKEKPSPFPRSDDLGCEAVPPATPTPEPWEPRIRQAILNQKRAVLEVAIEKGVDPDLPLDDRGTTPLMFAIEEGSGTAIQLLLEKGAKIDRQRQDGETALTLAVWHGQTGVVKLLLAHRANPNLETAAGDTALSMATEEHRSDLITLLKQRGARGRRRGAKPVLVTKPLLKPIAPGLSPGPIQATGRPMYARFRSCYELGLHSCPNLEGRIMIRFVIGLDGRVVKARADDSDVSDREVVKCVLRAARTLVFPEPEGVTVTVLYPVMFSPG